MIEKHRLPLEEYIAKILRDFPLILCQLCKEYTEVDLKHLQSGDLVDVYNNFQQCWYEAKVLCCFKEKVRVCFLERKNEESWVSCSKIASHRSRSAPFAAWEKEACEKAYQIKFKDIVSW